MLNVTTVGTLQEEEGEEEEEEEGQGGEYMSRNSRLMLMLEDELPNCHNQERVDEFAVRQERPNKTSFLNTGLKLIGIDRKGWFQLRDHF